MCFTQTTASKKVEKLRANAAIVALAIPAELADAIALRAAEIVLDQIVGDHANTTATPYVTIMEAAEYLRCSRQRVDDLLSQRRLSRVKDGGRTLILRAEIEAYLVLHPRREP
jgi:excisionase family DNA binding protein